MKFMRLFLLAGIILVLINGSVLASPSVPEVRKDESVKEFEQNSKRDLKLAYELFEQLKNVDDPKNIETVLIPLNELKMLMDQRNNLASLFQVVHPDEKMRKVCEKVVQDFAKLDTEINLSREIYDAVNSVELKRADGETKFHVEKLIRDFKRSGVDKDEKTRKKIRQLEEELVKIGQEFGKNIRSDVRYIYLNSVDELEGLPADYIKSHQANAEGKIAISTDYPDYYPFISYAKSDKRRQELYTQYRQRGYPANEKIIKKLLSKRYELAQTLGYENYAKYITANKMIKTPEAAQKFIDRVTAIAKNQSDKDYKALLTRLQKENPTASVVQDWQKTYIGEVVKKEDYSFDSQSLRPYFAYDKVKKGLLDITGKLFGVSYKKVNLPVWHETVDVYEMYMDGKLKGRFYLDMHPRADKYKHAMMTDVVTGISGQKIPEAALVCNFPGGDGTPGYMEHDQVSTYFHEFGHLLHFLFAGDHRWIGVSGISTEWDFVETPSILLEEWTWNPEILKLFATNDAGETLPDEIIGKMLKARHFSKGVNTCQQMFYAATSLNFYNRNAADFEPLVLLKDLQKKYTPFPYVDNTYMHLSFGHLDGYSAIYYTYMWSQVIAKDLFSVFEKEGLLNTDVSMKYRRNVLEPGGSKEAVRLVKDFLGREYSFDAFEKYLNKN